MSENGAMTLRLDLTFDQQGSREDPAIEIGAIGITVAPLSPGPGSITEAMQPPALPSVVEANAPNPFSETTEIKYTLGSTGEMEIRIYAADGRFVRNLFRGRQEHGFAEEQCIRLEHGNTEAPAPRDTEGLSLRENGECQLLTSRHGAELDEPVDRVRAAP